jgi:hypothetical protein
MKGFHVSISVYLRLKLKILGILSQKSQFFKLGPDLDLGKSCFIAFGAVVVDVIKQVAWNR